VWVGASYGGYDPSTLVLTGPISAEENPIPELQDLSLSEPASAEGASGTSSYSDAQAAARDAIRPHHLTTTGS
jgi:hypothetical protein